MGAGRRRRPRRARSRQPLGTDNVVHLAVDESCARRLLGDATHLPGGCTSTLSFVPSSCCPSSLSCLRSADPPLAGFLVLRLPPPAASAGPQVGSRSTSSMPGAVGRCRSMRIRGRETEGRGRRRDRPSSRWRSCCRRPTRRRPSGSTSRSRGASSRGRRRPAVPRRRPRSQGQGRGGRRPRPEDAAARPPLRTARRRSGVSRPLGAALGRYPASTARPSARSPPCSPRSTRRSDRCRSSRSATTSTAAAPCISTAASRSRRPTTEDAPGHGRNSTFRRARRGSSR